MKLISKINKMFYREFYECDFDLNRNEIYNVIKIEDLFYEKPHFMINNKIIINEVQLRNYFYTLNELRELKLKKLL